MSFWNFLKRNPVALFVAVIGVGLGFALWGGVELAHWLDNPSTQTTTTYAQPAATERSGNAFISATGSRPTKPTRHTSKTRTHVRPVVAPAPTTAVSTSKPAPSVSPSRPTSTVAPTPSFPTPAPTTSAPSNVTDPGDTPPSSPSPSATSTTTPVSTLDLEVRLTSSSLSTP